MATTKLRIPSYHLSGWKRRTQHVLTGNIYFWLFCILHVAFAVIIHYVLQGRPFRIGARSTNSALLPLYQADVSALISIAVVIIRFCYASWCGIVSWRIIYILLATRGVQLRELTAIAGGVPHASLGWKITGKPHQKLSLCLFLFIWLSLPAQYLSGPLLAASTAWEPVTMRSVLSTPLELPVAAEGHGWNMFNIFKEGRENIVRKSAGVAYNLASPSFFDGKTAVMRRYFAAPNSSAPVHSTISQITVPFLSVDKLEWVLDYQSELGLALIEAITKRYQSNSLNLTGPENPILNPVIGSMALLKPSPWQAAPIKSKAELINTYVFPEANEFRGQRYVAVLVDNVRLSDKGQVCPTMSDGTATYTLSATSDHFGALPPIKLLPLDWYLNGNVSEPLTLTCYAIAKLNLRAGSIQSSDCPVVDHGVAEASLPTDGKINQTFADPLVLSIFDAMPEVMATMAVMNASRTSLWNNLDGYTRGMVMLSYQSIWNVMMESFRGESTSVTTDVFPPEYMIHIQLEPVWFITWLSVHFAGVVSGLLFIFVSLGHDAAAGVRDAALASLRLDTSDVRTHVENLCMGASLSKSDRRATLRFRRRDSLGKDHHGHAMTEMCHYQVLEVDSGKEEDEALLGEFGDRRS
ncbi:hypothetical protein OQA88_12497 [Cercophora sp. LCS_1]